VAISDLNVVIFAGQSAGQPTGLTEGLLVGSGHENLDRFHLWLGDRGTRARATCPELFRSRAATGSPTPDLSVHDTLYGRFAN